MEWLTIILAIVFCVPLGVWTMEWVDRRRKKKEQSSDAHKARLTT